MRKLVRLIFGIIIGIFMIPALYALGGTLVATVLAFMAEPRVMLIILAILAVLAFPGMVIVGFIKK